MANSEMQLLSVVHPLMDEVHTVNNGPLALHMYNRPKKGSSALHSYIIRGDIALLQRVQVAIRRCHTHSSPPTEN
jgi:hypothetical protein